MKNQIGKRSFIAASLLMLLISFTFVSAQEKPDSAKHQHNMMKDHHSKMHDKMQNADSTMNMKKMDHKMKMDCMSKPDSSKEMKHDMKGMDHKMKMDCMQKDDSTKNMNEMKHDMRNMNHEKSSIVREGVIDLQAIDENKDGKVFQDQMDFNVISDEAGECPLCGMKLKEVTLEKAKEDLIKHDYKVKD